jgi:hypothetical protein
MLFSNSRDAKDTHIKISENNNKPGVNDPDLCIPIERVTAHSSVPAVKFLGVYFDCELNFKSLNTTSEPFVPKYLEPCTC